MAQIAARYDAARSSLGGRGDAALPVLFAALAVGAHVRVGTRRPGAGRGCSDSWTRAGDDAALAAGQRLARIAAAPLEGRPPVALAIGDRQTEARPRNARSGVK